MKSASNLARGRREVTKVWVTYRWPLVGLAVVVVLVLLASVGLSRYERWLSEQHRAALRDVSTGYEQGFAARWRGQMAEVDAALAALDLPRLIRSGPAATQDALQALVASQKVILGARLIEPGRLRSDSETFPPIGFAALEMLRQVEAGAEAPPEMLFHGTEKAHIAWLRPVSGEGGSILDHVLLALDPALAQSTLDAVASEVGGRAFVALQQASGSSPVTLAQAGLPALRQGGASLTRPVPGTAWRMQLWVPAAAPTAGADVAAWVWGALGVIALLVIAGAGFAALRRRGKAAPVYDGAVARVIVDGDEDAALARFDRVAAADAAQSAAGVIEPVTPPPVGSTAGILVEEMVASAAPGEAEPAAAAPPPVPEAAAAPGVDLPAPSVFRAYDVRGVVGETFNAEHIRALGRAVGSEAYDRGQQTLVVARDGRLSSPEFHEALVAGLRSTGRDVIDIGMVPTPVLYFATFYLNTGSGIMITGSHNPPQHNGLKVMLGGETLFGDEIGGLRQRLEAGDLQSGSGNLQEMDLLSEYIRRISEDIPVALGNAYRIVIDCGNAVAGAVAPKLFRALGHDVIELYCDIDGNFPNHLPDTSDPENLRDLAAAVTEHEADIGFGFDGDGDRLGVVDGKGNVILPDRLMMLYARDILSRTPGAKIVFDVECSSRLREVVTKLGGQPIMWKTGHSYMKSKLKEEGAELAGELSGHIFFAERWYGFDDAMYAAARLLEILMAMERSPTEVLATLPVGVGTPELRVDCEEGEHVAFMERFAAAVEIPDASVTTIDGVRADYPDGWGLVRASNTAPALVFRFEGDDEAALERIRGQFRSLIHQASPELELPF